MTLYICRSLFSISTFLCFTCVYERQQSCFYVVLLVGILSRVEPSDSAYANSAVICMSLRRVWLLFFNLSCAYTLYQLIARHVLKSLSIGFQGKKFDIFREHVLRTSIVPPGFLFQPTVCKFSAFLLTTMSLISYFLPLLYFHKVIYFVWRRSYIFPSIWSSLCISVHLPNLVFFLNGQWQTRQLFEAI